MAWVTINEADILAALNASEVEKYRQHLADGQVDPIAPIIASTMDEVRGYCLGAADLEATGVPPGLKNACVDIVIWRLAKRLVLDNEKQRKEAADDARDLLEKVAAGDVAIETESGESSSVPSPSVTTPDLSYQRENQDGI